MSELHWLSRIARRVAVPGITVVWSPGILRYSFDADAGFSISDATAETMLTMPAIKNANR